MRELMRLKSAGAVFWCWGAGADFEYASVIAGGYGQKIYVAPGAGAGAISIFFCLQLPFSIGAGVILNSG